MGNRYVVKQKGVTPGSGTDIFTIVSVATRRVRLVEVAVAGNGTTSAYQMIEVGRSSAGSSSSVQVTAGKFDHTEEPASGAASYPTVWGTQPTLDTNSEVIGWNALGGANRWIPPKGSGLEARNGEMVSLRASVGVTFQPMSVSAIVEED
jgi:hypothetical protein